MNAAPQSFGLVALVVLASCSPPPSVRPPDDGATEIRAFVDDVIRPLMAEHDVPGMAIAITVDGRPMFFNYGMASRASGAPVTERTLFEIGSVSKVFTATLVSYARALGRLSLDDRPGDHLPELRGSPIDEVRLLELGTYTAGGLPLQIPDEVTTDEQMIRYFREWRPTAAPSTQRSYSNPSIGLLGRLAARAMQGDFTDLMENRLLSELGLRRSFVRVPGREMENYAWGHTASDEPVRVNPGMFDAEAYGIKSTSADLLAFVQANIDPRPFDPALRRGIEYTHEGHYDVGVMTQGLGWEQYPYPVALERLLAGNSRAMITEPNPVTRLAPARAPEAPTLFNKTGSTNGFGAYVAFVPARRMGVVMLANRNIPIPARIEAAFVILERLSVQAPRPPF